MAWDSDTLIDLGMNRFAGTPDDPASDQFCQKTGGAFLHKEARTKRQGPCRVERFKSSASELS